MENYRIVAYYELNGVKRFVRRKFDTLAECREWYAENDGVEVVSGSCTRKIPFVGHEIVRVVEDVVERDGEVCED